MKWVMMVVSHILPGYPYRGQVSWRGIRDDGMEFDFWLYTRTDDEQAGQES